MKKALLIALLLLFPFFLPKSASASLIVIDKEGVIIWRVLGSETTLSEIPTNSAITVTNLIAEGGATASQVSLFREGGKITLNVREGSQEKSMAITSPERSLIEIEKRPQVRNVKIGVWNERFLIDEDGTYALTDFPIKIDPERAELSVETKTGQRILPFLPKEALETVVRAKIISWKKEEGIIELIEGERGELAYDISGDKVINVANVFEFQVPIKTTVSAITGEVLSVDQPPWLRVLGFLFS